MEKGRNKENDYLNELYDDLGEGTRKEYHMKDYDGYFEVIDTLKRKPKEDTIRQTARNYGYFALLSNEVKNPFEALSLYWSKDIVEKGFSNLKERLNFRRM